MTVLSETMASPVISPTPNPPLPVLQNSTGIAIAKAQETTAQYIPRDSLGILQDEVSCQPVLEVSTHLISDTLLVSPRTPWIFCIHL